jgi:hypothetical protein
MTEQTKRAAGRPKSTRTSTKSAPNPEQKKAFKRKVDKPTHKVYQTVSGGGVVYMLQTKGISMYDEETQTIRELRYCPSENSIWSDEQNENAVRKPILFRNGVILVRKDQPNLMDYLDHHPQNTLNGGNTFKVVDKGAEAEVEIEKEFKTAEAISMVRDKDINDLLPVAVFFGVSTNSTSSEIRHNLLRIAKSNPGKFISAFDDPTVRVKSMIHQAKDYNIIKTNPDGAYWFDSNAMIIANPSGANCIETLTRFCLTEKGATTLGSIEDQVDKL